MLQCSIGRCETRSAAHIADVQRNGGKLMIALQEFAFAPGMSLAARIGAALSDWISRRQRYRQVLRELRDYPAAELRELGIDPFRLETLARQAAGLRV
jgi:hypothetical protein